MTLPIPPLTALLLRPRRDALAALAAAGWRPWRGAGGLDAAQRRTLALDLSEPEVVLLEGGAARAVARLETDADGLVALVEVIAAGDADAPALAGALLPGRPGPPRTGGDAAAREWIWGPESGSLASVEGEPVRLWVCEEGAVPRRTWVVGSVVRRAGGDDE
jgi:hypothetical protein